MDGTICDIRSAVNKVRSSLDVNFEDVKYNYPWSIPGFFLELEQIPLAIDSVKKLSSVHDVWFLSRPSFKNLHSYTEKAIWIRDNFGYDLQKKLILCGDKSLLKGDILIDDSNNANQDKFEGLWIRIWNPEFPDWISVLSKIDNYLFSR